MVDPTDIIGNNGEHADRADARDSLFLAAQIRQDGQSEQAALRVRNLSSGGMMADCPIPLDRGARVFVTLRGVGEIGGRIAWHEKGRIGIAFDGEIDPKLARKPVGSGQAEAPHYTRAVPGGRPGLRT